LSSIFFFQVCNHVSLPLAYPVYQISNQWFSPYRSIKSGFTTFIYGLLPLLCMKWLSVVLTVLCYRLLKYLHTQTNDLVHKVSVFHAILCFPNCVVITVYIIVNKKKCSYICDPISPHYPVFHGTLCTAFTLSNPLSFCGLVIIFINRQCGSDSRKPTYWIFRIDFSLSLCASHAWH
jgi:hypothetical protein